MTGQNNLNISNFRVTDSYHGIYFNNVDTSVINNVTVAWCATSSSGVFGAAIYVNNSSHSNTIQNCYLYNNYLGFYMFLSSNNNFTNSFM